MINALLVHSFNRRATEIRPNLLYLAVFDGHGGDMCAKFCNQQMPQLISNWLDRGEDNLELILQNAFIEVNDAFGKYVTQTKFGECTMPTRVF